MVRDAPREVAKKGQPSGRNGGDTGRRSTSYNFPENRLTDHRINFTLYKLDQILTGDVQVVTDALIDYDRQQLRDDFGADD